MVFLLTKYTTIFFEMLTKREFKRSHSDRKVIGSTQCLCHILSHSGHGATTTQKMFRWFKLLGNVISNIRLRGCGGKLFSLHSKKIGRSTDTLLGCDAASSKSGSITIIMVLEIQNEAWLPNELRYSTFKAVISKYYDAAFNENISLRCDYDQQVYMTTYDVCGFAQSQLAMPTS